MKRRSAWLLLIVQLIAWALMTGTDAIEEMRHLELQGIYILSAPLIIVVLYFVFRKKLYKGLKKLRWYHIAYVIGVWVLITSCLTWIICSRIDENKWIVEQATGGFEYMLNGIEYVLFGILFGSIPVILVLIGECLLTLSERRRTSSHS